MVVAGLQGDSGAMPKELAATVFLVDDSAPIRERLKELLGQSPAARIVGEAGSADAAIVGIQATRPQFVVLDYKLEQGTGLDVLRAVGGRARGTVFIVLTNHFTAAVKTACMSAGAHYFLDKSSEFNRLNAIIADPNA
jgi:two-component system, NarL family, response regulator DevR